MDERQSNLWDIIIKSLGFLATSASILIGLSQFNKQQSEASELEFNRNFWQTQNRIYGEVCRNAGVMAASVDDSDLFEKDKRNFLSLYYGEIVLVEDSKVDSAMRELKSYIDIFDPKGDNDSKNKLKSKVLDLTDACKASSTAFKKRHLE
jgi:hypothetical protein